MIQRISLLLFVLGICLACNKIEKPEKPDNLIDKNKMVDILFDVFVYNSAKGMDKRVLENNNVTPDVFIFKKYNIDSLQFVKSNEYYAYDLKVYEELINKVEAKINAQKELYQKEIDDEEERRLKRLDSIKNLGDSIKPKKIREQRIKN